MRAADVIPSEEDLVRREDSGSVGGFACEEEGDDDRWKNANGT